MIRKFNIFHIVTISPWPLLASLQICNTIIIVSYNNYIRKTNSINLLNGITTCLIPTLWWKNTIKEANKEGTHLEKVREGIKIGIILFISSEVIFFLRFFWAYFHRRISPNIEIGQIWPPLEIKSFNPINVPLLNTIILVRSGFSITWSHHLLLEKKLEKSKKALLITLILGIYFSILQSIEYQQSEFSLNDSSYGTIFFIATGFHGIHVLIGSTFILVNILNIKIIYFTKNHHIGFEIAAWYWHFVDVIWLFLYLSIYWWGVWLNIIYIVNLTSN